MKPIDVTARKCFDSGVENDNKDAKFEVDDHVRILKYKKHFS